MTDSLTTLISEEQQLMKAIIEAEGEVTPDIDAMLALNQNEMAKKVDGYGAVLEAIDAEEEKWKARRDQVSSILKRLDDTRTRLRECLREGMSAKGVQAILGHYTTFKLTPLPKVSVQLKAKESELPDQFKKDKITRVLDKDFVLDLFINGNEAAQINLNQWFNFETYTIRKYAKSFAIKEKTDEK